MAREIKLGVVDDHVLFRKGIVGLLNDQPGLQVCLDAGNGKELLDLLDSGLIPDVLLLDLKMPEMNGLECLPILTEKHPDIKVLILSMYNENPFVMQAIRKGAKGYLLKDADPEELFFAIDKVSKLGYYINHDLSVALIKELSNKQDESIISSLGPIKFTEIELEILKFICLGKTAHEISQLIFRSVRTIEGHRHSLLLKTGCKNTANLVAWAFKHGFVH